MKILAIIPAYNEEECLLATVQELQAACPDVDYLVINDGSTDDTARICEEASLTHVSLPVNCGLAAGFRVGMTYALRHGYDVAIQFDSDGQHRPEYIAPMAKAMGEQDANIVIASRFMNGTNGHSARIIGGRLISLLIRCTTGQVIRDPTSGMRMYDRSMIELYAKSFDLAPEPDSIALLIRRGARVVEVPAQMRERQGGTSYLRFFSSMSYMARTCLSLLLFQWFR